MFKCGLQKSRKRKKGYQATFADFTEGCFSDVDADAKQVAVDVHSSLSVVEQLWPNLFPIFNLAVDYLTLILDVLKVPVDNRCPLARRFYTFEDFRRVFFDFVTSKAERNTEKVSEDSLQVEETSQDIPEENRGIDQGKVAAVIEELKPSACVPTEIPTETIETGFFVPSALPIYDSLLRIFDLFRSTLMFQDNVATSFLAEVKTGLELLCMKDREKGSITSTLKFNTWRGRWYAKENAVNAKGITPIGALPAPMMQPYVFERDLLLKVPSVRRDSGNSFHYRVIGIYTKYNNKWWLDKEGSVKVVKKEDKGTVALIIAMVEMDHVSKCYVAVLPSNRFDHKEVFRPFDAYMCREMIVGKLNLRPMH